MGNKNSTFERHIDLKDIQDNYKYDKKFSDTRFGDIKLLVHKSNGSKAFQKDHTTNTQKAHEDFLELLKSKKELSHPNLLQIYGYNTQKEEAFCSEAYKSSIFFEHFERDLEQEISHRQKNKDYFKEFEMWLILDSIVSACAYLQQNGLYHGDIRPFNIFITGDNEYKIAERVLFTHAAYTQSYMASAKELQSKAHYPGPQAFQALKEKSAHPKYDITKNDVFGLGMTLLEAACLERTPDVYNYNKYEMSQSPVEESLRHLRDMYSENLIFILRAALNFDENSRPDFIDLDNTLSKYRAHIEKNKTPLPSYETNPDQIVESLQTQPKEKTKRAAMPSDRSNEALKYPDEDMERRINEAIQRSDATLLRFSPKKKSQKASHDYNTALFQDFSKMGVSTDSPTKTGYVVDSQNYEPYSPTKVTYGGGLGGGSYLDNQNKATITISGTNPEGEDINKKIEDILSQSKKNSY